MRITEIRNQLSARLCQTSACVRERLQRLEPAVRRLATLDNLKKAGYYAALLALLSALALASGAYREKTESAIAVPQEGEDALAAMRSMIDEIMPTAVPEQSAPRFQRPLEGEILVEYAPERLVWSATLEQWQIHPGLDIAGQPGEAVYACADGIVADAWNNPLWGNVVTLEHAGGYTSTYANLNTLNLVTVGQAISAGEIVSAVGRSAACESEEAAHLHFELKKDGVPVDFEALLIDESSEGENGPDS